MFSVVFLLLFLLYYSDGDIQMSESTMITRQVKSLTCNSNVNLARMPGRLRAYHAWNQVYNSEYSLGVNSLPVSIESFHTRYTVELYKFDNNTDIYSMVRVYNASNGLQNVFNLAVHCSGLQIKWISLVDDGFYRYQVDHIIIYNDSRNSKFSCQHYSNLPNLLGIQIGWITTAGDKIYTYNETVTIINLSDTLNGSMFCCLFYTTTLAYNNEQHIQRFVKDITLLIYEKEMPNSQDQPLKTDTKNETERNRYITTSSTTAPYITDTSNAIGKRSRTTKETAETTSTTTEAREYPDTTTETSETTDTANETNKYSGTTNVTDEKASKRTGTAHDISKYSGNTNVKDEKTSKRTGTAHDISKHAGNTNVKDENTSKTTGTENDISQYSGTTNVRDENANNTNKTIDPANGIRNHSGTTNRTDSNAESTDYIIVIISSIFSIMVLIVVGICVIRRYCCKKSNRPERARLPLPEIPGTRLRPTNEPDPNTPFYLNLLFRRECELEIQAREEPHYEEVIYQ